MKACIEVKKITIFYGTIFKFLGEFIFEAFTFFHYRNYFFSFFVFD